MYVNDDNETATEQHKNKTSCVPHLIFNNRQECKEYVQLLRGCVNRKGDSVR